MTPERYNRIAAVLSKRQPDLTVITDEVHKGRNLSAIVRTCDAVGVDCLHAVLPAEGYQQYGGTSASAEKWVDVQQYTSILEPVVHLKDAGFQILAANVSADAIDFRDLDYTRPTAVLMGAEIKGVSEVALQYVDHNIVVPMAGMVESFNVSVACAIVLMEAQRQRQLAGMYDQTRLSDRAYKKRFMHWAHPVIARFCDERGLSYPDLREDGEIAELPQWYAVARQKKPDDSGGRSSGQDH